MIKKILGVVVFFIGLSIIFFSLYSSYNIFTGKEEAPQLFQVSPFEIKEIKPSSLGELESLLQTQLQNIFPASFAPKMLNLVAWSIFAGILIFGGGQVASLGIKLMK